MKRVLFTVSFWLDAAERAIKTFAQTLVAVIGVDKVTAVAMSWRDWLLGAGFAAGLSVLTSVASASKGGTESPASLVPNMNPPEG